MKVYICATVPDYIGIEIEAIFFHEADAKAFCEKFNKDLASYDRCDYEEYEVK